MARAGMSIGLLGGSFDPAHKGHAHITREALKRFGLDRVWWLVSPGNPLKEHGPAPLAERIERACAVMRHPHVDVTDIETRLGTRVTARTLAALRTRYRGVRFVWLMGADNLAQIHRWQDWRWIMDHVPVGVLARPGQQISACMSPAARIYRPYRIPGSQSQALAQAEAPAWCFVNVPMVDISSSEIRAAGKWTAAQSREGEH
nr:nicotinate-nucleotide adenylyltransferase [Pontibaca salina]